MSASPDFPRLPVGWIEHTETLPGASIGNAIFYREFSRAGASLHKRGLFIVHGFGEQSDRFLHFPHYLHTCVDTIGLIDLPGHGHSPGGRGHIDSFETYSEAALAGFAHFQKRSLTSGVQSWHWMGASMGGLVTLRTLFERPNLSLKSVIVTEAQLGIAVQVPALKEFAAGLLHKIYGSLSMHNEIDAALLSHDASVQKEYLTNPLNHSRITPATYFSMKTEMQGLQDRLAKKQEFPYPLYMLVPLQDQIVSWSRQLEFFSQVQIHKNGLKKLSTFPHAFHELFNETDKSRPFVALEHWLSL